MTVSPNRPQDGNLQANAGGSGPNPNDHARLASLPPTLFKLPNLSANARGGPSTSVEDETPGGHLAAGWTFDAESAAAASVAPSGSCSNPRPISPSDAASCPTRSADPLRGTTPSATPTSLPQGTTCLLRGAATESGSPKSNGEGIQGDSRRNAPMARSPEPTQLPPFPELLAASANTEDLAERAPNLPRTGADAAPASTASSRRPLTQDVPAGRSWMESLGSHGVVIVLLLVVVAAALLSGNGEDDPAAKSLSTQSELLNFDDLNVDLPLPSGTTMEVAEVQANKPAETVPAPTVGTSNEKLAGDSPSASNEVMVSPSVEGAAPAKEPVATTDLAGDATKSEASLQQPLPNATANVGRESAGIAISDPTAVQFNQFVVPSDGIDAKTVANRVDVESNDASTLPSLEELAGLPQQTEQGSASVSAPTTPSRTLTETPAGISDWSKYLPPLDAPADSDAESYSFPNQVLQP